MKLHRVCVEGLFGTFNHIILFHEEPKITLLLGRNGLGKTVMLKMIDSVFSGDLSYLKKVKFDAFKLYFDNDTILNFKCTKEKNGNSINIIYSVLNEKAKKISLNKLRVDQISANKKIDAIRNDILHFYMFSHLLDSKSSDKRDYNDMWENVKSIETIEQSSSFPTWLSDIKTIYDSHFISTDRMLKPLKDKENSSPLGFRRTVMSYSDDIKAKYQSVLAKSSEVSTTLDRSFPDRVMELFGKGGLSRHSVITLSEKLEDLSKQHELLEKIGLLKSDEANLPFKGNILNNDTVAILSMYVDDSLQKLEPYLMFARKLEVFIKLLNSRFLYKSIKFSQEKGFVVYSTMTSDEIQLTDLSSGEQHLFILYYELLFKYDSKSLLMIDEPEISLHVSWQKRFIEDLLDIIQLNPMTILMATHSPNLIGPYWNLVNELKCDID